MGKSSKKQQKRRVVSFEEDLEEGSISSSCNNSGGKRKEQYDERSIAETLEDDSGHFPELEDEEDVPLCQFSLKQCLFKSALFSLLLIVVGALAYYMDGQEHKECLKALDESFPEDTKDRISQDPQSPQARAWQWTKRDPKLMDYKLWRHRQRFALATIYFSFNGDTWDDQKDWLHYHESECEWQHLRESVCDDRGLMRRLVLSSSSESIDLQGTLPPEASFLHLEEISIVGMSSSDESTPISDLIPSSDPEALGRLAKLDLSETHLEGSIPSNVLGLMTNLEELNLSNGASLSGGIPSEVGLLTRLTSLSLNGNNLSGPLPTTELASLSSLQHLHLQDNEFTGRLSSDLCSLTSLNTLRLHNNRLEGAIPHCVQEDLLALSDFTYEGNQLIPP